MHKHLDMIPRVCRMQYLLDIVYPIHILRDQSNRFCMDLLLHLVDIHTCNCPTRLRKLRLLHKVHLDQVEVLNYTR